MAARQAGGEYNLNIKYSVKISCSLMSREAIQGVLPLFYPDCSCQFDLSYLGRLEVDVDHFAFIDALREVFIYSNRIVQ